MKRWIIVLVMLACAVPVGAASLTETSYQCEKRLIAELDDEGAAHVIVQCVTFDSTGAALRGIRGYDVTAKLTSTERARILSLLQQIPTLGASQLVIPTPTP